MDDTTHFTSLSWSIEHDNLGLMKSFCIFYMLDKISSGLLMNKSHSHII